MQFLRAFFRVSDISTPILGQRLGNIVFFSSNAYQFGGGAFYLPYFIALFLLGIPVMILEFGLGAATGKAFPSALHRIAGKKGEFVGWWAQGSALFITMFYVAIWGWALGMMIGTFGSLFEPGITAPFSPFSEPTTGPSAMVFFFNLITTAWPLLCVIIIWVLSRHGLPLTGAISCRSLLTEPSSIIAS